MAISNKLKTNRAFKILSTSEIGSQILVWLDLALENNCHFSEINTVSYCEIYATMPFHGVSLEFGTVFEDCEGITHLTFLVQSRRGRNGNEDRIFIMLESKSRFQSNTIFHMELPVISKSRKK